MSNPNFDENGMIPAPKESAKCEVCGTQLIPLQEKPDNPTYFESGCYFIELIGIEGKKMTLYRYDCCLSCALSNDEILFWASREELNDFLEER